MIRGISSKSLQQATAPSTLTGLRPLPLVKESLTCSRPHEHPASGMSKWTRANTASHRFHFSNFRYYLTLFSKFFASFPHGTCSLSVSHQYLALDGIYHPLRAAIPSNSTLIKPIVHNTRQYERDYHPPWYSIPGDFTVPYGWFSPYRLQFRRFSVWALPASLAVTEGILVSFFSSA